MALFATLFAKIDQNGSTLFGKNAGSIIPRIFPNRVRGTRTLKKSFWAETCGKNATLFGSCPEPDFCSKQGFRDSRVYFDSFVRLAFLQGFSAMDASELRSKWSGRPLTRGNGM